MPGTSPDAAREHVARLVAIYAESEQVLLDRITRRVMAGDPEAPGWLESKLAEVVTVRRDLAAALTAATASTATVLREALTEAVTSAVADTDTDLRSARVALRPRPSPAVEVLVREGLAMLATTHLRATTAGVDAYTAIVREAAAQSLTGTLTRQEAAQRALTVFARRGITGYIDSRGRSWDLVSYVEAATRGAVGQAAVTAHIERLTEHGQDLVAVSDSPQECELCRPFEGQVLSISGASSEHTALAEARRAGLWHPGCTHATSLYFPGRTTLPTSTQDPQGYADSQRLRTLERQVRAAKRAEAVAVTQTAAQRAGRRVADRQAAIAAHVATSSAIRRRSRERITGAR